MDLYRYSLNSGTAARLNEPNYIIKFPRNDAGKPREVKKVQVLYTTPFQSNDANDLNNRLSITYYPLYRLKVGRNQTLELINNVYEEIKFDSGYSSIPRTWPAFGKDGGVPEVLIIAPDPVTLDDSYIIQNGGAFERWHQDNVENLELPLAIGSIISKALSATEEFTVSVRGRTEGYYPGLMRDGNLAVNSFHKDKYVTISAAYEFVAGILYVKIWAAHWAENVNGMIRFLLYESTDPLKIVPCWLDDYPDCLHFCHHIYHRVDRNWNDLELLLLEDYVGWLNDSNSYPYFQISDAVAKLLWRVKNMSLSFFASHSKRIFLP